MTTDLVFAPTQAALQRQELLAIVAEHGAPTLARVLAIIAAHDTNYAVRNPHIYLALGYAAMLGYACGVRLDPKEPDWPVAFIELPEGQVSWHLPPYPGTWDGHTTEEKLARVEAYTAQHPHEMRG